MIKIKCTKHPQYKAQLPPRASCEACYEIYMIVSRIVVGKTANIKVS